jgi:hypothetical protein
MHSRVAMGNLVVAGAEARYSSHICSAVRLGTTRTFACSIAILLLASAIALVRFAKSVEAGIYRRGFGPGVFNGLPRTPSFPDSVYGGVDDEDALVSVVSPAKCRIPLGVEHSCIEAGVEPR